jgi:cytochrome c-type biogenesis protein CcmH
MIWVCILLVAAVALAPFGWSVWHGGRVRGRRDAAIALHRAQLAELDRDLAEGRLLAAEHEAARLEVQRRLLAEADRTEAETARSGPLGVALTAALVPAVALVLYLADGMPDYAAHRAAAGQQISDAKRNQELLHDEELVARLRATLAKLDPHAERTQHGYVMLGNAELELGHLTEAVEAWKVALAGHFDPRLGAETAELITETTGHVTPEAESLFKRALAEAPPNVPWRQAAEKRVAEAGKS